jgi:pimeloyl-ACP methyl ester carboxylesterase
MPTVTTNDGAEIFFNDKGESQPIILIHGWGCSHRFFLKNVDELAHSFRVIPVDLRAHGDSQKVLWGHRISRYAKDIHDLVERLELEGVVLVGWSMGAAVIWSYIELFGNEHLAGQVCVDQSPRQYYSEEWRWGQPGCYDAEALAILTVRLEYDPKGVARGLVPACFGETPPSADDIEFLSAEIDKCPPSVRAAIMADHTHLDWRDLLPQIKLPTLVCVGRQSKVFPWEGSAFVGEHIPGATTVFFENSGHMPFYEEPEKFNQIVGKFVKSIS